MKTDSINRTETDAVEGFAPIVDEQAEYLVLGTAPSVDSLKAQQYYARRGNRFWAVIGHLFGEDITARTYEERVAFLKAHHVAVWDTLKCCRRKGSMDSAITQAQHNDIDAFCAAHPTIRRVILNGKTAEKNYQARKPYGVAFSTSPANCQYNMEEMVASWKRAFGW
jgi:TDG/mug DNA glycosylase family protein